MAMILKDRVQETTSTVGLGNVVLTGAAQGGFRTFSSVMATGDTAPIAIADPVNNIWESALATMQADGSLSLSIKDSSSAGSAISLAANGGKTMVMLTPTADWVKTYLATLATGMTMMLGGVIATGAGNIYTPYSPFAWTVTSALYCGGTVSGAGFAFTVMVNGSPLGGLSGVSTPTDTSFTNAAISTSNTIPAGAFVSLSVTSVTGVPANGFVTLNGVRALY